MTIDIALDKAEIVALFVECVLYGIFVTTFVACLYILVYRRKTRRLNYPMVGTALLLCLCATLHVGIDLARVLVAFRIYLNAPGGPTAYFGNVRKFTHVLKSAVYITETCISDALVVYRCHVVVRRYAVTILLTLMVLGSAVAGYGSVYMLLHSPPFQGSIFNSTIAPWITSFNVITAATNVLATCLIAYSIWRLNKLMSEFYKDRSLSPATLILIESGVVYAFALVLLTVFYTRDCNAQYIVLDAVSPLIGIVFCGIIIRVGLQPARTEVSDPNPTTWLWTTQGVLHDIPDALTLTTQGVASVGVTVSTCHGDARAGGEEPADALDEKAASPC